MLHVRINYYIFLCKLIGYKNYIAVIRTYTLKISQDARSVYIHATQAQLEILRTVRILLVSLALRIPFMKIVHSLGIIQLTMQVLR